MHQSYIKSEHMLNMENWAKNQPFFHTMRRVSMAANIVDGHLVVGNRHFCPIMIYQIELLGLDCKKHDVGTDQGFIDQWGIYMSREEAWFVAKNAGQIREVFVEGVLFSECYL